MITDTSLESYYSEAVSGRIGKRQRELLEYAISRHAFGVETFTRADIKAHFGDDCDGYVTRARELADMGLLVLCGTAVNAATRKENQTWRVAERVLQGDLTAEPTCKITRESNEKLLIDLLNAYQESIEDRGAERLELKELVLDRMRCGTLRDEYGNPVRKG